jgi:uncharacterized membrane protein
MATLFFMEIIIIYFSSLVEVFVIMFIGFEKLGLFLDHRYCRKLAVGMQHICMVRCRLTQEKETRKETLRFLGYVNKRAG